MASGLLTDFVIHRISLPKDCKERFAILVAADDQKTTLKSSEF